MSNGDEGVLHISQSSMPGASRPDVLVSYSGHLFGGREEGVLPLCRDAFRYSIDPVDWVMDVQVQFTWTMKHLKSCKKILSKGKNGSYKL